MDVLSKVHDMCANDSKSLLRMRDNQELCCATLTPRVVARISWSAHW